MKSIRGCSHCALDSANTDLGLDVPSGIFGRKNLGCLPSIGNIFGCWLWTLIILFTLYHSIGGDCLPILLGSPGGILQFKITW